MPAIPTGYILLEIALARLGPLLIGEGWIQKLTAREEWLADRHHRHGTGITFVGPSGSPLFEANTELGAALMREFTMRSQHEQVEEWLEDRELLYEIDSDDEVVEIVPLQPFKEALRAAGLSAPDVAVTTMRNAPAEARLVMSRPVDFRKSGRRGSEIRADIEAAIDCCCPIDRAIEVVALRKGMSPEGAWDAIKLDISLGRLPAQCIDDRGERVEFAPHWIQLLARFQLPTEPDTLDQPISTVGELLQLSDFPSCGVLWFDRRRAAENRLARRITKDNRAEPSLPPIRVRDVVVNEVRLDKLYPENAATSDGTVEVSAQSEAVSGGDQVLAPRLSSRMGSAPARPPGVSASAWMRYQEACRLKPEFEQRRGGISEAARAVAQSHGRNEAGARRDLTRVLAELRKNNRAPPN